MTGEGSGFDALGSEFGVLGTVFPLFLLVVIGIAVFMAARGFAQWSRNNRQPVLTVEARLVSKRTHVTQLRHAQSDETVPYHANSNTWYYLTFEVDSGDRIEFKVDGTEYGMLAQGDRGKLMFQGTRYFGFRRNRLAQAY